MSALDVELNQKLQELDFELEEGEITQKGYEKRRSRILSQYLPPSPSPPVPGQSGGLRVHSVADTAHPSNDGSPAASLAALTQNTTATQGHPQQDWRRSLNAGDLEYGHEQEEPPRRLGVRNVTPPNDEASLDPSAKDSRHATMLESQYAFKPQYQDPANSETPRHHAHSLSTQTRQSTILDQGYFQDFGDDPTTPHDDYGGGLHRYSGAPEDISPARSSVPPASKSADLPPTSRHLLPLEPREVPFAVYDPHDTNTPMAKFDNIASVLRHRAVSHPKQAAYWVLDQKGREFSSITWEKLASRAEKVAQVIRDKSNLYRGDRVALIYRDAEIIDFVVALMGCFLAGVVAVPINDFDVSSVTNLADYHRLNIILTTTQAHLALTTDVNLKTFQRDITAHKLHWPRGVEWWKTNEFGTYHPKRKEELPPLVVPDLAYIEFSRAPTGDLRGVVISHKTIMHQMACLSAILQTIPGSGEDTFNASLRDRTGRLMASQAHGDILLSYLDPRHGVGLIFGVMLNIYGGHTTVWMDSGAVEIPGLYANSITKYKASLLLANYPGLKMAVYNYQQDPMATRNYLKKFEPNFSSVKLCMIDTLTVDAEFHEILADRWLKPLRNLRAREVVSPMLCLPEHGGMVISMRDWLGGEERMGCPLRPTEVAEPPQEPASERGDPSISSAPSSGGYSSLIGGDTKPILAMKPRTDLSEILLDKEALKTNEIVVVATDDEARARAQSEPGCVRVGAFGYPIPDGTLAVVDPETSLLCTPSVIGEIWVDSPSLSGGFWALPKHTESIFHARPYRFQSGNPTPLTVDPEFLRTGLLGCVFEGKVFVLGLYEDRIRQRVEWVEHGVEMIEHRYFFVQHLVLSILRSLPKIHDCTAFDIYANEEHLPVIILESYAASTAPTTSAGPPRQLDTVLLDSLSERVMDVLIQVHQLRVYCVMITAPNTLPRVVKNGRKEIGNMLCRKEFDTGSLPCVHVKFGVERAVLNLPIGIDPIGGTWSPQSSAARHEILHHQDKQYSGVDYREVVIDDRTSTPLNNFKSIVDLLQWRVTRQAEELAYCTIDGRGREGKGVTWRKFDIKVASVAQYLRSKVKVVPGDHLILMYTHSEEFVYALHACFCLGAVAIPAPPLDQNRLHEDAPAFLHMISDFRVKAVLVNNDVDHLLKQKIVSQHIKQSAQVLRISIPHHYNTSKPPRQSNGCRDLGFTAKAAWIDPNYPVLVWTYWSPDQRRTAVQLGHETIMGICKVQKETCQMTSSRPVLGCVRSTVGLGLVHSCLMGVFVGAPTYLVSPVDFAQNPLSLFLTLSRYKIKDTYATAQMLDHAMSLMAGKGFALHELKNMMIATDGRPRTDVFQKVRLHFAATGLDRTAINTIYSHVLNPMIASRSYMCIEPIELWLDTRALRRGLIQPVDPESDPHALLLQDSGMVPVSTQIAIVNPETDALCHIGEYGEIWVQSEACVKSFYGSRDAFDHERFNGRTVDGDPSLEYVRTGDLGFLHNVVRPIGPSGQPVEMQVLFVLGAIGETFEVNGLSHFPMDIENLVEKCHRNIVPNGCAVFQAGGLVVVTVEVTRKAYLASLVPVIVNIILSEHQLIVDIVAFVGKGEFPRSRLGEKQRGKILASWVTRKLNTIAQFSIRDSSDGDSQLTQMPGLDSRIGSIRGMGSSLKNVETASPQLMPFDSGVGSDSASNPTQTLVGTNVGTYESSIVESPQAPGADTDREETPTENRPMDNFPPAVDRDFLDSTTPPPHLSSISQRSPDPFVSNASLLPEPLKPRPDSSRSAHQDFQETSTTSKAARSSHHVQPSASPDGPTSSDPQHQVHDSTSTGADKRSGVAQKRLSDLWTLPSSTPPRSQGASGSATPNGYLNPANQQEQNRSSQQHDAQIRHGHNVQDEEDEWQQEALMHMDLVTEWGGAYPRSSPEEERQRLDVRGEKYVPPNHYDGSGYG